MEDVKLTWYGTKRGPFKDRDVISRSEYDLPAPYNGVGSTMVVVTISSDQRDEEKPEAALLVMMQYMGDGLLEQDMPQLWRTAKKMAERGMAELVQKVTGTWKPRSERESPRQGGECPVDSSAPVPGWSGSPGHSGLDPIHRFR